MTLSRAGHCTADGISQGWRPSGFLNNGVHERGYPVHDSAGPGRI